MRFVTQKSSKPDVFGSHSGETVVSIYDGVLDQVRAVREASAKPTFTAVPYDDDGFVWGSSEPHKRMRSWDDVVEAVATRWEWGVKLVEQMVRALRKDRLPRPQSLRPRKCFREDDGVAVDVDRAMNGQPLWQAMERRPVGGPRVITLAVQIGANAGADSARMLWRGASALGLAQVLEDAGYRAEIVAYDVGRFALARKAARPGGVEVADCVQATWIKRSSDKLNTASIVNAVAGWYFRSVNFGSLSAVPGWVAGYGFGAEGRILPEHLAVLVRGCVTPWVVHGVGDLESSVRLCRELLGTLAKPGAPLTPSRVPGHCGNVVGQGDVVLP